MHSFQKIIDIIRARYGEEEFIPLHAPVFLGNEKKYLAECIDSTFVSSVGPFVNQFEQAMCAYTGAKYAIATVNGTAALHIALKVAGIEANDEVITQAFTFVATANAITYAGAKPVFIDIEAESLSLCPKALRNFLEENSSRDEKGRCINKHSGRIIRACVPMHTFGLVAKIEEIASICSSFGIILVEDAAESIGSFSGERHTGTFGRLGAFSFNGNKPITAGGGGAIITNDLDLAKRAKHLTTTAKVDHPWEFFHDEIGYNYRMPNINAALICAQMEKLGQILNNKRETANYYHAAFYKAGVEFIQEAEGTRSNYWLNCIIMKDQAERDAFLTFAQEEHVMCRPVWRLMTDLPAFSSCQSDALKISREFVSRIVNIPSSYLIM